MFHFHKTIQNGMLLKTAMHAFRQKWNHKDSVFHLVQGIFSWLHRKLVFCLWASSLDCVSSIRWQNNKKTFRACEHPFILCQNTLLTKIYSLWHFVQYSGKSYPQKSHSCVVLGCKQQPSNFLCLFVSSACILVVFCDEAWKKNEKAAGALTYEKPSSQKRYYDFLSTYHVSFLSPDSFCSCR